MLHCFGEKGSDGKFLHEIYEDLALSDSEWSPEQRTWG
jgi:hypothetical protein